MKGELFALGKSVNMFPVEVSVQDFMSTHSLIIGQTRSGKSHLTRMLIEQTHGKCSQFVFDREGEYVTLREQFDFVVIGEGWDFKASPAIAAELAVRLLRLGASAIIDLSSMKHKDDLEFVRGFIDGLMSLKLDEQREAMLVLRLNKSQVNMLQSLHRGEFFVAGPAIQGADNALLVTINDTQTHAPNRRNWKDFRLAPAKGAVLAALGELQDVEQEVKEKAQTIEQLRTRIIELEKRPPVDTEELVRLRTENAELYIDLRKANLWIERLIEGMRDARSDLQNFISEYESGGPEEEEPETRSIVSSGEFDVAGVRKFTSAVASSAGKKWEPINGIQLPASAQHMLAYAASRYPHAVTRGQMVAYARISSKSSNVGKFLKLLTEQGYLQANGNGYAATALGCQILPDHEPLPDDPKSKLDAWRSRLSPGAVRMLDAIAKYHSGISKDRVLEIAEVSRTSSNAGKFFKQLQEYGLITVMNDTCRIHEDYQ